MKEIVNKFYKKKIDNLIHLLENKNDIVELDQIRDWNRLNWNIEEWIIFFEQVEIIPDENDQAVDYVFKWNGEFDFNNFPIYTDKCWQDMWIKGILYNQFYLNDYVNNFDLIFDVLSNQTDIHQLNPISIQYEYVKKVNSHILYCVEREWKGITLEHVRLFNRLNWSVYNLKRFYDKVDVPKDDSVHKQWVWIGSLDKKSYGRFGIYYGQSFSHRLSYHQVFGSAAPGIMIRHIGDVNKSDINIFSILSGNSQDNVNDQTENGNIVSGENHSNAKLTNTQVYQIIRVLYDKKTNITQTELAKNCGVVQSVISAICRNTARQESMKQFAKDRNISVKEVVDIIQINVDSNWKKINSEINSGSNHPSAQLHEEIIIKGIIDRFMCGHSYPQIYRDRIINNYNVHNSTIRQAIKGDSWKGLDPYRDAAKEMKLLNYPSTTSYPDLINFMRNDPKYKNSYYLDQIKL